MERERYELYGIRLDQEHEPVITEDVEPILGVEGDMLVVGQTLTIETRFDTVHPYSWDDDLSEEDRIEGLRWMAAQHELDVLMVNAATEDTEWMHERLEDGADPRDVLEEYEAILKARRETALSPLTGE